MKKTLPKNVPAKQRSDLKKIVAIIRKHVKVEMVILFGSYARGDFVVYDRYIADGITYTYQSDFDLFVVVSSKEKSDNLGLWYRISEELVRNFNTDVTLAHEDIDSVNDKISEGLFFYVDLLRDGVILYDSGNVRFTSPKKLRNAGKADLATRFYKEGRENVKVFLKHTEYAIKDRSNKMAAFTLHQATEQLLYMILLVHTNYTPKIHNLNKLFKLAAHVLTDANLGLQDADNMPRFASVVRELAEQDKVPSNVQPAYYELVSHFVQNKRDDNRFKKLCAAYIEARYNSRYKISNAEVVKLHEQVLEFKKYVEKVCKKKIKSFGA